MRGRVDVAGALMATTALMLAGYAAANGNRVGWISAQTLAVLVAAGVILVMFVGVEARVKASLMPPAIFRIRNFVVANIAGLFSSSAVLAWSFLSAFYLQFVLKLTALQVGLIFLPANLVAAMMSLVVLPMLVMRLGARWPLVIGMLMAGLGLALLAQAPLNVALDVLPGMFLLGLGSGMAYNPLFFCALNDVAPSESGVASGIVTTSLTMGGALGLSVFVSIAAARTHGLVLLGVESMSALSRGYQVAFCLGAASAALGALVIGVFLRSEQGSRQDCGKVDERTVTEPMQ